MNFPLISIIVPVYKTPIPLLQRFLKSALGQTLADIQFIAVDDASPDDCPEILDTIAAKDNRMIVIHRKKNGRAGMARGDGLAMAKGKYILFADADDIMQPDMCETLYNLALKASADIVACSWSITDHEGNLIGNGRLPDRQYDMKSSRQRAKAYRCMNYALWNKIFRHEVIASLRFEQFEANIGEDTLFNVAALCRSRRMVTTSFCGYDYIVHTTSATGRSVKGMPYLQTLELSDARIRQTIAESDRSKVGKKFSDWLSLKRFITGCGWIAEQQDPKVRTDLWSYWRHHLTERILPSIESSLLLAAWFRLVTYFADDASNAYRLTMIASKVADPFSFVDKLQARIHAIRFL
jgi:glycosyltransferase involved in cell wall biosynthesis